MTSVSEAAPFAARIRASSRAIARSPAIRLLSCRRDTDKASAACTTLPSAALRAARTVARAWSGSRSHWAPRGVSGPGIALPAQDVIPRDRAPSGNDRPTMRPLRTAWGPHKPERDSLRRFPLFGRNTTCRPCARPSNRIDKFRMLRKRRHCSSGVVSCSQPNAGAMPRVAGRVLVTLLSHQARIHAFFPALSTHARGLKIRVSGVRFSPCALLSPGKARCRMCSFRQLKHVSAVVLVALLSHRRPAPVLATK